MADRVDIDRELSALEADLDLLVGESREIGGDFWAAFAARARRIEGLAGAEHEHYARNQLQGMPVRYGIVRADKRES